MKKGRSQEETRAALAGNRDDFTEFENDGTEVEYEPLDPDEADVAKKVLARLLESGSLGEATKAVMGRTEKPKLNSD